MKNQLWSDRIDYILVHAHTIIANFQYILTVFGIVAYLNLGAILILPTSLKCIPKQAGID